MLFGTETLAAASRKRLSSTLDMGPCVANDQQNPSTGFILLRSFAHAENFTVAA
jgi:hypothetical protein